MAGGRSRRGQMRICRAGCRHPGHSAKGGRGEVRHEPIGRAATRIPRRSRDDPPRVRCRSSAEPAKHEPVRRPLVSIFPRAARAPMGSRTAPNWQTGGMNSLHPALHPGVLTNQEHRDEADSPSLASLAAGEPCVLLKQGGNLPQGEEQAAVRADAERQCPRGGPRHRGACRAHPARGVVVLRVPRETA